MRLLDSRITAKRRLDAWLYAVVEATLALYSGAVERELERLHAGLLKLAALLTILEICPLVALLLGRKYGLSVGCTQGSPTPPHGYPCITPRDASRLV